MKTKIPKISIKEFNEIVEKERSQGSYFVSGLIIRKSNRSPDIKKITADLPKNIILEISQKSNDKKNISLVKDAFGAKKWLVFYLSDGFLSSLWREQLSRLRDSNSIFVQGKSVEDTFFAKQSDNMRIVAVIDDKNIKKVEYPQFLNLFNVIIEI